MLERRIYHVQQREDHSWQVVCEGFHRPHIVRNSQAEAILMAKRLAKVGAGGRVVVHNAANAVEREFTILSHWE